MKRVSYDIVIVGSGAGGGTVAQELSPLCRQGLRIAVLEKGPRLRDEEFTGRELEMAGALYEDGGGFLTADGTMTIAFGCAYGGSTVVYTGTSMLPPERVIQRWDVAGLTHADLDGRARKFMAENNAHLVEDGLINENNKLFVEGCRKLGYDAQQFPVNIKGCRGSSLCNLGCPNQAKQGTDRVQLPRAERNGVEVVTRCQVLTVGEKTLAARVAAKPAGTKGDPSPWEPGDYQIDAKIVVLSAGAVNTPALLLRSGMGRSLPRLGYGFTSHPAFIMVGEHARPIVNFVGHPKSYYVDQFAEGDHFVLETCMYFPFITAKSMAGFGEPHSAFMRAFPRLQMILVLACDEADAHNRVTIDKDGRPVVEYRFQHKAVRGLIHGAIDFGEDSFRGGSRARPHAGRPRNHHRGRRRRAAGRDRRRGGIPAGKDARVRRASARGMRHGQRTGQLRHRFLRARAWPAVAVRGGRQPVPQFARNQSLRHHHGAGRSRGPAHPRGGSRTAMRLR